MALYGYRLCLCCADWLFAVEFMAARVGYRAGRNFYGFKHPAAQDYFLDVFYGQFGLPGFYELLSVLGNHYGLPGADGTADPGN